MPTFAIDTGRTFAAPPLFMASGPKMRYQTTEQDVSTTGERKWEVQAAATWHADPGQRPFSDLIRVTVLGGADPGAGLPPGTPVEFDQLRVGVMTAEAGENGRVRGGKPFYQAAGVRAVNGHRQPVKSE
jgi:hypothetical protein